MQQLNPSTAEFSTETGPSNALVGVASALVVCATGAAIMLAVPEAMHGLTAFLGVPFAPGASTWVLPALASGVAIGATALGVLVLSRFVQGVQSEPFAWLAPVLVVFSALVAANLPAVLPGWQGPVALFATLSALVLLGGGALLRSPRWPAKIAGGLACAFPVVFVLASYVQAPGGVWTADASTRMFLYALLTASVGVVLLAGVAGTSEGSGRRARLEARLAAALARARESEQRLAEVARQPRADETLSNDARLRGLASGISAGPKTHEVREDTRELALRMRPGLGRVTKIALASSVLGALGAAAYFGAYQPLVQRAAAQAASADRAERAHATALAALRVQADAERTQFEAALATERDTAKQAQTAAEAALARVAALEAERAAAVAEPAPPPKPARRHATRRHARAKAAPSLAGQVNDDPIGGLDGT